MDKYDKIMLSDVNQTQNIYWVLSIYEPSNDNTGVTTTIFHMICILFCMSYFNKKSIKMNDDSNGLQHIESLKIHLSMTIPHEKGQKGGKRKDLLDRRMSSNQQNKKNYQYNPQCILTDSSKDH